MTSLVGSDEVVVFPDTETPESNVRMITLLAIIVHLRLILFSNPKDKLIRAVWHDSVHGSLEQELARLRNAGLISSNQHGEYWVTVAGLKELAHRYVNFLSF